MRVRAHSSAHELADLGWDSLDGADHLLVSSPWLRLTEDSQPPVCDDIVYLTGSDDRGLAAGLVAYPFGQSSTADMNARVDVVLGEALEPIEGLNGDDLLPNHMSGGWAPMRSSVLVRPDITGPARVDACQTMLDDLQRRAFDGGARSVAFLAVREDDVALCGALERLGYAAFPGRTHFDLPVRWATFDEYLHHFDGKRRRKLSKEIRSLEEAGVRFEVAPLDSVSVERQVEFAAALAARYLEEFDTDKLANWLGHVARTELVDAHGLFAWRDGQLLGYVVLAEQGGALYSQHGGFDYEACQGLPVYFGLAYYETIRHAISRGLDRVDFSVGADDAKRLRGCDAHPQRTYCKAAEPPTQQRLEAAGERAARGGP